MNFIHFTSHWWLIILLPLLGVMGWTYLAYKKKQQSKYIFTNNITNKPIPHILEMKTGMVLVGIVFLLLAVWQPQWGEEVQKTEKKGLDIIFTIDVSKSMNALDFSQKRQLISRLDATKFLVENFAKNQKSDRLGLVEFAGESFVASPLTLDHTVFFNFLHNISSDDLGKQGTNLAEALEVSLSRLEVHSDSERGKVILLFSDGDETISSQAEKMAKLAQKKGIKIFTVGIGSENGMPIPEGQNAFGEIVYKKWKGETVITKLNPDPLKKIAKITGANYFHAENINDLTTLEKELKKLPTKVLSEENISPKSEQYFPFAALGLLLFILGFVFPEYSFFSKFHKKSNTSI